MDGTAIDVARERVRHLQVELKMAKTVLRRMERRTERREKKARKPRNPTPLDLYRRDVDECDKLMARIVKVERYAKLGHCEACPQTDKRRMQWAHGITRGRHSVRWEFQNGRMLCDACHLRFTRNQPAWEMWLEEKLGATEYGAMRIRSQIKTTYDPRIMIGLRHHAEQLGVLTDDGWKAWQECAS